MARFLSRFYQTATLNHDSETHDHITWFTSTGLARVRLGKALQTSASIRSQNGLGEALYVAGRQRPCGKHDHRVRGQVRDRPDRPKPTAEGMCESVRHKFCTASLDYTPLINGFVFAPPDRSILIQPSEVTRLVSIPNWLCLALFSVPGPSQRERLDAPVPSARCCCLLRSHPSSPRTRHPPCLRHLASAIHHLPLATRHSSGGALWTRVVQFPGLPVPFRANLGHPIQRGPSVSACRLPASPALQCRGLDDPELGLFCIKKPESIRR